MAVATGQADIYDRLLCRASGIFTTNGWRLRISAERLSRFETSGPLPGLQRELLHLWSIPSFNSLPNVMACAADNPNYVKAQRLTIDEAQNLYMTLRWDNPIGLPDTPVNLYMMETLQIDNGVGIRWNLANYMNEAVYRMSERFQWKILFAGNASTGIIDQYVHIWGLQEITDLEDAILQYRGHQAWADAVTAVSTSMWIPRKLDPPGDCDCFARLAGAPPRPTTTGAKAG